MFIISNAPQRTSVKPVRIIKQNFDMKELLKKAFEAGKDRQYNIEWQLGRGKPDFEEWYKEHESEALALHNVVGRSEQLKALEDLKQWCFETCQPFEEERLHNILNRL